jgi:hypothetical protein
MYRDFMYCPECDEQGVDFNSVAVTQSRPSFTGEIGDTGVYGTAHTSKTNVVNVCKGCGCNDLYANKGQYLAACEEEQEKEAAEEQHERWLSREGLIISLIVGPLAMFLLDFVSWQDNLFDNLGTLLGCLLGFGVTWILASIGKVAYDSLNGK